MLKGWFSILRASPSLFFRKKWMFLQASFPAVFRAKQSGDNGANPCIIPSPFSRSAKLLEPPVLYLLNGKVWTRSDW